MKINSIGSWCEIGGKRFYARSKAETRYAIQLQFLKDSKLILDWNHEPTTFWFEEIKRGVRSYKPDFQVRENDGTWWWAEVKGFLDGKSRTKIKRFAKYYPGETLRIIDSRTLMPIKLEKLEKLALKAKISAKRTKND